MEPVRLFIGTSANGEDMDAEMVYAHSLKANASIPLDITWMRLSIDGDSPWGGWDTRQWPTPFSGFRWAIPEVCQFQGRAIYTDVDMINFRDIAELWNTDMRGAVAMARKGPRFGGHEFCVMLIDCAKMQEHVIPIARQKRLPETHFRMIQKMSGAPCIGELDPRWNVLDGEQYAVADMWQLHFTNMATQPWAPAWYRGPKGQPHPRPDLCAYWLQLRDKLNDDYAPKMQANIDYPAYGPYTFIGK